MCARDCVSINLAKKLPPGVWVNGKHGNFFQPVEYEGISLLCFKCGMVGHKVDGGPLTKASMGKNDPNKYTAPTTKDKTSSYGGKTPSTQGMAFKESKPQGGESSHSKAESPQARTASLHPSKGLVEANLSPIDPTLIGDGMVVDFDAENQGGDAVNAEIVKKSAPSDEDMFGPWTLVSSCRKKANNKPKEPPNVGQPGKVPSATF